VQVKKPLAGNEIFQNPKTKETYMCYKLILQYPGCCSIEGYTQRCMPRFFDYHEAITIGILDDGL